MKTSDLSKFKKCIIIDIDGNTYEGLYSRNRLSENSEYKYKYCIRADETEEHFTVEPFVAINFYGLFFTNTEIKFPEREISGSVDRISITKDEYIEVKSLELKKLTK